MTVGLISTGLRGLGLAARFALTLYMAKYLNLKAVGEFGLVYGVISIAPAFLGLGLNFRLNREIISVEALAAGIRIRDRLSVTLVMTLIASAAVFLLSSTRIIPPISHTGLIIVISILEVLAFDIHMSLISMRMPVLANTLLFIRTGSWIIPYIGIGLFNPRIRNFDSLLYFWFAALVAYFAVLFINLRSWPWTSILKAKIDRRWIVGTVKSSGLIYASDLGIVGSMYLDRFIIEYMLGIELTGIFTFFGSIANAIQVLVNVGVIQVSLPRLVDTFRESGVTALKKMILRDLWKVVLSSLFMSLAVYVVIVLLLPHMGRARLLSYPWLFPTMIAGAVVRLGSDVLDYGLYASGMDSQYAWSNLAGIILSAGFTFVILRFFGFYAVGLAPIGTALVLLLMRIYFLFGQRTSATENLRDLTQGAAAASKG